MALSTAGVANACRQLDHMLEEEGTGVLAD